MKHSVVIKQISCLYGCTCQICLSQDAAWFAKQAPALCLLLALWSVSIHESQKHPCLPLQHAYPDLSKSHLSKNYLSKNTLASLCNMLTQIYSKTIIQKHPCLPLQHAYPYLNFTDSTQAFEGAERVISELGYPANVTALELKQQRIAQGAGPLAVFAGVVGCVYGLFFTFQTWVSQFKSHVAPRSLVSV